MGPIETGLRKTKELLEAGWCQKAMARDKHGYMASSLDEEACAFCLIGATNKAFSVFGTEFNPFISEAHSYLMMAGKINHLPSWNDNPLRTKEEVIAVVDGAILSAQKDRV